MSNSEHNQMRKLSFLGFGTENNADPDAVKLDDEMAKVFGSIDDNRPQQQQQQQQRDKFDIKKLSTASAAPALKANRSESDFGRTAAGSSIPSAMRRRESEQPAVHSLHASPTAGHQHHHHHHHHGGNDDDDEPLVSERARGDQHYDSDSADDARRVKFSAAGSASPVRKHSATAAAAAAAAAEGHDENDSYDEDRVQLDDHRKRKARHQHYKHRKTSLQDGSAGGGSNSRRSSRDDNGPTGGSGVRRVSIQPEDSTLEEADIEELTAHRSDDPRAMRRHKVQAPAAGQLPAVDGAAVPKKHFDHSPHEVFVQLDELTGTGEEREWKETARWIKYEEDLEEGSDRWGRPHVASLSFHSLLNLRRCLETGVVLMDLEERDLPGVAYRVVEQMVVEELIQESEKPTVMRALLLRHRHVNEHSHGGFYFGSRRKFSSYTSLQNLNPPQHDGTKMPRIVTSSEINGKSGNGATNGAKNGDAAHTTIDMKEEQTYSSQTDLKAQLNDSILRRIPVGAEATTVLVGAVDFLRQPTIAFVRLAEGIPIPGITEVPIPVRFIFILLGPKDVELDYHEVGRSIATLMSNEHFHKIAYAAEGRHKLLSAINDFLDESIVLPPGNWQRDDLLPFDELKAKSEWIRDRKQRALQQRNRDKQAIADEEHRTLLGGLGAGGDGGGDGGGGGKDGGENGRGGAGRSGKELHVESAAKRGRSNVGPLEKTHRLWGGLINDIRRRYPMYRSDILDGLNTETLAATVFMYFAALSTAITFGGLASDKTHNLIGISETLLSASVVGMLFHALSGQPLVIIGTTGPLLLFDEALYRFCEQNAFDFLSVRVYVGGWIAVIALLVSAFEGSVYVRLFSRFTQEIFSALITLIYIVETVMKLIKVYQRHPLLPAYVYAERPEAVAPISAALLGNETTNATLLADVLNVTSTEAPSSPLLFAYDAVGRINQPNTALFCTMLTLGTFAFAYYLRLFRNWHFLGRTARRALGDFGVPLSICLFVTVDFFIPAVFTEKLSVPEGLSPSDPESRGWLIPLGSMPAWVPFACVVPAMLVYILIFMESHISELIVDKPERGLKKGSGLHMDIVLLSFLNVGCGLFGMPWHCAATVRSVTHVSAVTIMSRTHAPGDKPYIADVKEQRVSGFCVALMVGLSVMASPILRLIPMSVLFGVFLYMGVASMSGVQLFDRLRLFFMPVKYHPAELYVKRVPTWKMHVFTAVQLCSLGVLWTVASSRFSLAFPFVLVLMVPLRQRLERMFTAQELIALDGNAAKVDPNNEPDFYEQASIPA